MSAGPDLFGDAPAAKLSKGYAGHPGMGPQGESCGSCEHHYARRLGGKRYYKCDLVPITFGPGTDIRLRTAACERWEKEA